MPGGEDVYTFSDNELKSHKESYFCYYVDIDMIIDALIINMKSRESTSGEFVNHLDIEYDYDILMRLFNQDQYDRI